MHMCWRSALWVAAVISCGAPPAAAAASAQRLPERRRCLVPAGPQDVVDGVSRLCGGSPVVDALRLVGVHDDEAAAALLRSHGFRTALDLRLLAAGAAETEELMEQLRLGGTISLADRSKIRLLLGDREARTEVRALVTEGPDRDGSGQRQKTVPNFIVDSATAAGNASGSTRRALQSTDSNAVETIAIALSVLVGTIGYVVQGYTSRRAELAAKTLAAEQQLADKVREREHEQLKAQIARTDRCE